ncbi:MAG: GTP-dependent dephospho-CoA kinase family protein [Candidatus Hadarchaeales archaeon]
MKNVRSRTLLLPDELRPVLRRPLGALFSGVGEMIKQLKPSKRIVTVGDRVTAEAIRLGIRPDIAIVDLREMRKPIGREIELPLAGARRKIMVKNPAGSLTPGLFSAISEAKSGTVIVVDGEEDLAALPAILLSPIGTSVIYGQPGEGAVLVAVTRGKKEEIRSIVKKFKVRTRGDRSRCPDEA